MNRHFLTHTTKNYEHVTINLARSIKKYSKNKTTVKKHLYKRLGQCVGFSLAVTHLLLRRLACLTSLLSKWLNPFQTKKMADNNYLLP